MLALIEMNNKYSDFMLILFIAMIVLTCAGCNSNEKFNSEKWKQKSIDWWMGDTREKMVVDLINSDTIIGMIQEEVIELLGQPEYKENKILVFLIREKYSSDIDPDYISNLKVKFDKNGRAINCEIEK